MRMEYVTLAIKQNKKWIGLAKIKGTCIANAGEKLIKLGYPNYWTPGYKIDWSDTFEQQKNFIKSENYKVYE